MNWRAIEGFPGYSVSERGDVRNDATGQVLRARPVKPGMSQVCLHGRYVYVHRLMQQAFDGREYVVPEISVPFVMDWPGEIPDWYHGVIILQDASGRYARHSGFAQAVRRSLGREWRVWSRKKVLYAEKV